MIAEQGAIQPTRIQFRQIPLLTVRACTKSVNNFLLALAMLVLIPGCLSAGFWLTLDSFPSWSTILLPLKFIVFSLVPLWIAVPLGLKIFHGYTETKSGGIPSALSCLRILPCFIPLMTVLCLLVIGNTAAVTWVFSLLPLPETYAVDVIKAVLSFLPMLLVLAFVLSRWALVPLLLIDRKMKLMESIYFSEQCMRGNGARAFLFFFPLHFFKIVLMHFSFDSTLFLDCFFILLTTTIYFQSAGFLREQPLS